MDDEEITRAANLAWANFRDKNRLFQVCWSVMGENERGMVGDAFQLGYSQAIRERQNWDHETGERK